MQNFKQWCISWFSIPEDDDARGIVVRVLDYTYYLKPIILTFKDPYIEVEYQIATRRLRLQRLTIVCLMHAFVALEVLVSPYLYDLPNNIYSLIQWTAITVFVNCMGHLLITRWNRFAHITQWPTIFCVINLIITIVFILINIEALIIKDDPQGSYLDNLSVRFISGIDTMERGLYGTYVMYLIAFLLLTVPILDLLQFLGLAGCYTLVLVFVSYRIHSFYNSNFSDIHYFIMDAIFTIRMPNTSKEIVHGAIEASYPYKQSYFNLQRYQRYSLTHYIYIWILMMITMMWLVYNQEIALRADFILRRVRSTKDNPRNLDGGIHIETLVDEHESATDVRIRAENLAAWKKESDSNSQSDVDARLEDLGESIPIPQGDAISMKSASTFDRAAITAALSGLIPETYTKSEVSINIEDKQENLEKHSGTNLDDQHSMQPV